MKLKLAVIFGGRSTEHDVSVTSGLSVLKNLNQNKYQIYPIYIDKDGLFYQYKKDLNIKNLKLITNIFSYLKKMDVIFPVLHGLYGEDGTIQGLFSILNKKYVGCHTLSSAICMDKVYTKIILNSAHILQAKSMYIQKIKDKYYYINKNFLKCEINITNLDLKIKTYLKYPVFIKPSNSGSSVGVNKANNKEELEKYLQSAFTFDNKVLIEEAIKGKEVECAIIGNNDLIVSTVGEIIPDEDYYSYESKYLNNKSKILIPANIDNKIINKIQKIAKRAYMACNCEGLSRIDFFIEDKTNKIILNEINSMPGFTEISMYPKLIQNLGYTYEELLDMLISLALEN